MLVERKMNRAFEGLHDNRQMYRKSQIFIQCVPHDTRPWCVLSFPSK